MSGQSESKLSGASARSRSICALGIAVKILRKPAGASDVIICRPPLGELPLTVSSEKLNPAGADPRPAPALRRGHYAKLPLNAKVIGCVPRAAVRTREMRI